MRRSAPALGLLLLAMVGCGSAPQLDLSSKKKNAGGGSSANAVPATGGQCLLASKAPQTAPKLPVAAVDPKAPPLSYAALKQAQIAGRFTNVDSLLAKINTDYAGLLSRNYVVLKASESPLKDEVTPAHPRLVFHDGNFIFAMATDPAKASYNQIESIELDAATNTFKFRVMNVANGTFDENPQICATCHNGRPIWGAYDLWPNAFGGNDDTFHAPDGTTALPKDVADLAATCKTVTPTSRLRFVFGAPAAPGDCQAKIEGEQPSSAFTNVVSALDYQMIAARVREQPVFYGLYKYALVAAMSGCPDVPSYLPKDVEAAHQSRFNSDFDALGIATADAVRSEYDARKSTYVTLNGLDPVAAGPGLDGADFRFLDENTGYVTGLRYLVEGQTVVAAKGLDMTYWSMSAPPGKSSYSFAKDGLFNVALRQALIAGDPDLANSIGGPEVSVCSALKTQSLAAITAALGPCP